MKKNILVRVLILIFLLLLVVLGAAFWPQLSPILFPPAASSGMILVSNTPEVRLVPSVTSSPTATLRIKQPTWTPYLTAVIAPHALETPIGIGHKFVIHRVHAGENLIALANQYLTSVAAIQAVNYNLPSPVMVDWLLVIPVRQTDVQGLPTFEPYEIEGYVVVEALAQQLSVDPEIFKSYNALGNSEVLSAGEWVLIPHLSAATP